MNVDDLEKTILDQRAKLRGNVFERGTIFNTKRAVDLGDSLLGGKLVASEYGPGLPLDAAQNICNTALEHTDTMLERLYAQKKLDIVKHGEGSEFIHDVNKAIGQLESKQYELEILSAEISTEQEHALKIKESPEYKNADERGRRHLLNTDEHVNMLKLATACAQYAVEFDPPSADIILSGSAALSAVDRFFQRIDDKTDGFFSTIGSALYGVGDSIGRWFTGAGDSIDKDLSRMSDGIADLERRMGNAFKAFGDEAPTPKAASSVKDYAAIRKAILEADVAKPTTSVATIPGAPAPKASGPSVLEPNGPPPEATQMAVEKAAAAPAPGAPKPSAPDAKKTASASGPKQPRLG